jgi:chromosome segregation ATPase
VSVEILALSLLGQRTGFLNMVDAEKTIPSEQSVTDDTLREPLASLTDELTRISAEIQSINSGFQVQLQSALLETRKQIREELQREFEKKFKKELEMELERRMSRMKEARSEVEKATEAFEKVSREIDGLLEEHATDLSHIMRKKAVQSELKAYLDGLRFVIGD